jgi:hypothetical protein
MIRRYFICSSDAYIVGVHKTFLLANHHLRSMEAHYMEEGYKVIDKSREHSILADDRWIVRIYIQRVDFD